MWLKVSGTSGPPGMCRILTAMPFKASQHGEIYRDLSGTKGETLIEWGYLFEFSSIALYISCFVADAVERQSLELTAQHCSAHLLIYFLSSSLGFISSQVHASPRTEVTFFSSHLRLYIIKLALFLP